MKMLGADILESILRLLHGNMFIKIFLRLPAIVASEIGLEILPFFIQKPLAPRL